MDMSKLLAFFCLLLVTACNTNFAPGDSARLRITQHQTSCCYMEGQVSFLEVANDAGVVLVSKEFRIDELIQPVIDGSFGPGIYTIRSWQRPCAGNCGSLDPVADQCEETFTLEAGAELFVTAAFAPRAGCSVDQTRRPLQSPMPDAVALRAEYRSCGEELPVSFPVRQLSRQLRDFTRRARDCLLAANLAAEEAEMLGYEVSGSEQNTFDRVIYVTHMDRSVEVFKRLNLPEQRAIWQHYSCSELLSNEQRVFTLTDCNEPVELSYLEYRARNVYFQLGHRDSMWLLFSL